ncbi:MAG TPA: hypothetical protein VG603_09215 [Chitinophagales bacterium]|nr:hypothetical protein [Chitinophagales bacterium]
MAINQNHTFDDLDGVKCAIVEKNCKPERVEFLKSLLELNGYTVVVAKSPPPKAVAPATPDAPPPPAPPETFTVGVTDVTFNATNAIFGRLLHTKDRHVVTLKYWQQKENVAHDEIPYFQKK